MCWNDSESKSPDLDSRRSSRPTSRMFICFHSMDLRLLYVPLRELGAFWNNTEEDYFDMWAFRVRRSQHDMRTPPKNIGCAGLVAAGDDEHGRTRGRSLDAVGAGLRKPLEVAGPSLVVCSLKAHKRRQSWAFCAIREQSSCIRPPPCKKQEFGLMAPRTQ